MYGQCRGVFGEEQNALRARSAQRVQLWKGLHPSALSEAVSHFTKVQQDQVCVCPDNPHALAKQSSKTLLKHTASHHCISALPRFVRHSLHVSLAKVRETLIGQLHGAC